MQITPNTWIGVIVAAILTALVTIAVNRVFESGTASVKNPMAGTEDSSAAIARAQQEALRAKADADAAALRDKATRDALALQEEIQERQRRMREAAEAERIARAERDRAYRQAHQGCQIGTHLRCFTANDSRTGAVLSNLGCSCESDR